MQLCKDALDTKLMDAPHKLCNVLHWACIGHTVY